MIGFRRIAFVTTMVVAAAAMGSAGAAAAQVPAGARVELRVLVVSDGGPSATAIADELRSEGVPLTEVDLNDAGRPTIDADFLADTTSDNGVTRERAHYQAVVLPGPDAFGNATEPAALSAYQQHFDIPQVNAFAWPQAAIGLNPPTYSGPLDGVTATLTTAGQAAFAYLRGPVPFEDNAPAVAETWGFPALPAGATPLLTVTAPDGSAGDTLIAEYAADGRRQLSLTFSYNSAQTQFRLLAPGIVNWMTGGVHLGLTRNFLSVQVDDVFLPDSRWSSSDNCTPGEDCPAGVTTTEIRMDADDASAAAQWQVSQNLELDMVFNANGSVEAAAEAPNGHDPLTDAMVAQPGSFRWTNHTFSHEFLGCLRDNSVIPWRCETDANGDPRWTTQATITSEINQNFTWAATGLLPLDDTELVTGEHSGLHILPQQPADNPHLAPALAATGITWLAADNSRMPQQVTVGPARTVPRYPMNVYFNVGTQAEQVDEYNWIYTSRSNGGSGICEDNPLTVTCITPLSTGTGYEDYIVPLETRFALTRMLGNDPRPHYVHQANIAEERILYPLLDSVLTRYRSLLADNAPIVNPRLSAAGAEMLRQDTWRAAVAADQAGGYLQDKQVHVVAASGVAVPITAVTGTLSDGSAFGEGYGGSRSAWTTATAGTVDLVLP